MQMTFLPEIDRKKTQKAVEDAFEKYRLFKYLTFEEREASITAGYKESTGSSNKISDQTAQIATYNIDEPERRKAFCERVERAVNRLPLKEKFLVQERYMSDDSEYITDYTVYCHRFSPPISEGTYSKIRWKAFYKLALNLNIAVVKEGENSEYSN